jgi:uncharacterized tellurite resistance protein B-like protein
MPTLLFPAGPAPRTTERGTFQCPACGVDSEFSRVVVGRIIRVFAMRVPAGAYGEYIECQTCLATFRPAALAFNEGVDSARIAPEYERALLRVLALLVVSDGEIHNAEVAMVQRVYAAVTGEQLTRPRITAEAREVADQPMTVARYLADVVGYLNDRGKEQVLRGAALVSGADGRVHRSEAEMIRRLGAVLQLDDERIEDILRSFT